MPSLSSILLGHSKFPQQQPCYTFHGPDNNGQIQVLNTSQGEVARFLLRKDTITCLSPTPREVCTFKRSSLSGTTTLNIHGQQIKVKQSWEGMQYGKDIMSANPLKWRPGSGGYEELRDGGKLLLARGKLPGTLRRRPAFLEVFVPGDEFLLDLVMASWFSTIKGQDAEKDELEAVAEISSALLGG